MRASRHFVDGRFQNLAKVAPGIKGNPLPLLGEYFFGGGQRTPPSALPIVNPAEAWARAPATSFRVTWLGHSTVLLEVDGVRILTDPVFGDRASPVSFAGPKRFHAVPAPISALPALDLVLLSHDHYDHLCKASIIELAKLGVPIVTALGVGAHLESYGFAHERITELDWNEHYLSPTAGVRLTALPSQHFSGRGLNDRNATLWASWVIETERHRIFFSGDTGLFPELADIGRAHGPFDLAMLEVGAFHPSWGDIHLGPENALAANAMLGGGLLFPVHWGTFNLALHDWDEPAEILFRLAEVQRTPLFLPRLGAPTEPAHVERPLPWWREVARRENIELTPSRI